jgi:lipopolysaccharide/colanic/teichoic acid biosynthesis glycosyltransferase
MNYPKIESEEALNYSYKDEISQIESPWQILCIGGPFPSALTDSFQTIYFDNYQEAAYHLQHNKSDNELTPKAIIGIHSYSIKKELEWFSNFLKNDKRLSSIPFILVNDKGPLTPNGNIKPVAGIDDIIRPDISVAALMARVKLLNKFKTLKKHDVTHTSNIPTDRKFVYKVDALFKRALDILIASLSLIILSPIFLIIAILIKIDSRGPVFYTSYRAGSNYRIFKFLKFRTMVVEADNRLSSLSSKNQYNSQNKNAPVFFKISNDPRITRIGKFLRNTSLDELPQLLNVLKADMSLVGNRPLPLYEARVLTTDRHAERFNAPAGITGLWQISKRGNKEMSAEERIALDIDYARHNSFTNDLQIILKTPRALIQKDNV